MSSVTCPSCAAAAADRFCAACGEKMPSARDYSVRGFLAHAIESAFDVDGRLLRSLRALLLRPGLLTQEYMRGAWRPYLPPLQLFLLANFAFFMLHLVAPVHVFTTRLGTYVGPFEFSGLARSIVERHAAIGSPEFEVLRRRFDEASPRFARSLIIIMVPMTALLFAALQVRKRRFVVEHLVFSTHFFSFVMLYTMVLSLLTFPVSELPGPLVEEVFGTSAILLLGLYMFLGFRRNYGDGRYAAAARALVAVFGLYWVIVLYRLALFLIVMATVT